MRNAPPGLPLPIQDRRTLGRNMEDTMAGENRTPDKAIGEVKHAQDQAGRTTGHQPPHGPDASHEEETVRAKPDQNPQTKKTGEF